MPIIVITIHYTTLLIITVQHICVLANICPLLPTQWEICWTCFLLTGSGCLFPGLCAWCQLGCIYSALIDESQSHLKANVDFIFWWFISPSFFVVVQTMLLADVDFINGSMFFMMYCYSFRPYLTTCYICIKLRSIMHTCIGNRGTNKGSIIWFDVNLNFNHKWNKILLNLCLVFLTLRYWSLFCDLEMWSLY